MSTYLIVPFDQKDKAKKMGAWWDPKCKTWFIRPNMEESKRNELLNCFAIAEDEIMLDVCYEEKDEAKELGARWNKECKCWYVPRCLVGKQRDALCKRFSQKEVERYSERKECGCKDSWPCSC